MRAVETRLAEALKCEEEHVNIATRIVKEVLPDNKAASDVRASCLRLIDWLTTPAEIRLKRAD